MARSSVKKAASRETVTIGEIIELVKGIESQCRTLRMLLQRLDKTMEVKLTAQLKSTLKAQPMGIPSIDC
jgi:hypothetical protein